MEITEAAKLVDMHVASERERLTAAYVATRGLTVAQRAAYASPESIERYIVDYRERLCRSILGERQPRKTRRTRVGK
jgi:hypothetical protein